MRDHPARNRPESKIALVSGAARGTGASVVRGGILMRYALRRARGVRQDPAATFGVARTPVPWHGLMLACAASQLGGALVPLPGGLGGVESGALGALALSGTHPATAAGAVIVYRVARYWVPGAAGAVATAALTRRARAADRGLGHPVLVVHHAAAWRRQARFGG